MRVLIVSNREPDPQGPGDAKTASYLLRVFEERGARTLLEHARMVPPWRCAAGAGKALLRGRPLQLGLAESAELARRVDSVSSSSSPDLVVAVHARATQFIPPALRRRTLALLIDSYALNYETYRGRLSPPLDAIYRLEARRMANLERSLARHYGCLAVVSAHDANRLRMLVGSSEAIAQVPAPVDVDYFAVTQRRPSAHPVFVFAGRLNYLPNSDAARSLMTHVWPALKRRWPGAELRVAGAHPSACLRRLATSVGASLLADLPDIRTALADATAVLVPMRMGGGVQNKVLEAFAAGLPVVCSPFTADGLGLEAGEQVLLAETPESYVEQVARLIAEPELASSQVERGQRLVRERHSMERFGQAVWDLSARIARNVEIASGAVGAGS